MRVILLGPPGAGKGTQAVGLAARLGVPHIATGDILRAAVHEGTEVGLRAKSFMDAGELVPDSVIIDVIDERLHRTEEAKGFVLDGFPRTVPQAEALDELLADHGGSIDHVALLLVPDGHIIERISKRRSCAVCGRAFNLATSPPAFDDQCDVDKSPLMQREDDHADVVANRLGVYHKQTEPLVRFYEDKGLVRRVDGVGTLAEVEERLAKELV